MKKIKVIKNQRKTIEKLKREIAYWRGEIGETKRREKTLQEKLKRLGSEIKTLDGPCGPIQVIDADVEIWGTYAELSEDADTAVKANKQLWGEEIRILAEKIARSLIENNLAQVIYKSREKWDEIPGGRKNATLGVKLFVVPWEQMRTGSRIQVMRQIPIEEVKRDV